MVNIETVRIEIAKLECRPLDIIAVKCPENWNPDQMMQFRDYLSLCFPDLRFMCLFAEMDLTVVTPPDEPAGDPMLAALRKATGA